MGMLSMMNIGCTNLHNPICDWLIKICDKGYRSFVIPGRGRIPLDKVSVFNTLGVPRGRMDVPYKVGHEVKPCLFAEMFPGMQSLPLTTALGDLIGNMKSSGADFTGKLLVFLISSVFVPTTLTFLSNRCYSVLVCTPASYSEMTHA